MTGYTVIEASSKPLYITRNSHVQSVSIGWRNNALLDQYWSRDSSSLNLNFFAESRTNSSKVSRRRQSTCNVSNLEHMGFSSLLRVRPYCRSWEEKEENKEMGNIER